MEHPMSDVPVELATEGVTVGWLLAEGCTNGPSPAALVDALHAAAATRVLDAESPWATARKSAVRDLLRHDTYKPTGRAKPASEYLLRTAVEGDVPVINVLADANNVVSIETLFPISIVDLDKAGTDAFVVRWGREGESYVFNPSGQELGLRDLLLVACLPTDTPCATPVKDSQATKTDATTRRALGIVYGPASLRGEVKAATERLAGLLTHSAGATVVFGVLG
jgi:DNA/RNA-binding domain of Phe-tRNA-synthetase-like protein